MRRKIKYLMPVMLACSMMQFSCSDWTDPESINIHTPSMEEQNPELYAQYLESLNNFKATDHQVVIVSVNNVSTVTTSRSQHLTDMPDSLDYICLNNTMEVNQANISEMKEVRRLGTKVLGLVDFDAIESAWNQYEMSYLILMASAKNVPTDRFIMGVTTPYLTNSGSYNGELGDGSSAIIGAAQWAVAKTPDYTKAGISIDAAEKDYFNASNVYPTLKEAISILSPTVK